MKNTLAYLAATTVLTMGSLAFAADETASGDSKVHYKDNGGYEATQSSKQTDSDGTTRTSKSDVNVDVDKNGKVTKKVKVKTTSDPKGLMNKKTSATETTLKEKDNGGYDETVSHSHTDNGGTNTSAKSTTNVDVDNNGNVTKVVKTKNTVDPKGLNNAQTTTTKTKSLNDHVVDQTTNGNANTDNTTTNQ